MSKLENHRFTIEEFVPLNGFKLDRIPHGEMLFNAAPTPTEDFFKTARANKTIIETDLKIFESAICTHLDLACPVSINLNIETYFDDRLIETIEKIKQQSPQLNYAQICLEMTEHGKIPDIFDDRKLTALTDMGFTLALDDFDPRKHTEWKRLNILKDFIHIIKLPHEIMTDFREDKTQQTSDTIRKIRAHCPDKLIVMEGVQESDNNLLSLLQNLGVNIIQKSNHTPSYLKPLALTL